MGIEGEKGKLGIQSIVISDAKEKPEGFFLKMLIDY